MSRITTLISDKGGVGRTTLALNLAYAFAALGRRTLVIDADPQGGLAAATGVARHSRPGFCDVSLGEVQPDQAIAPTRVDNLSLLAFGDHAFDDRYDDAARGGRVTTALRDVAAGFDQVFVDAPAGLGTVVRSLLSGSDAVLAPVTPTPLSVRTLPAVLRLVALCREAQPALQLDGVVMNLRDVRSETDAVVYDELRRRLPVEGLLSTVIPFDEAFKAASGAGLPAALQPEGREAGERIMQLAAELCSRQANQATEGERDEHPIGLR